MMLKLCIMLIFIMLIITMRSIMIIIVDWLVGTEGNRMAPRMAMEDPISATSVAHSDDNTVAARNMEWLVGTEGNRMAPRLAREDCVLATSTAIWLAES